MPSEKRTIVFDNADIKDAIAVHHPGTEENAGPEQMGRLSISNDAGISIQVMSKDGNAIAISLDEEEVIAALIEHCRSYTLLQHLDSAQCGEVDDHLCGVHRPAAGNPVSGRVNGSKTG